MTPPTPPKHPQMTITDFNYESSYLPSWICNIDVRVHIGRSTGRCTHPPTGISWPRMAISEFYCYSSYRKINWQIYAPQIQGYTVQEWQFQISIFSYRQINWQIYPPKHTISSLKSSYNGTLYGRQMDCIAFNKSNLRNYYNGTLYCRQFTWKK